MVLPDYNAEEGNNQITDRARLDMCHVPCEQHFSKKKKKKMQLDVGNEPYLSQH